jgi:YD repeat-containing protein
MVAIVSGLRSGLNLNSGEVLGLRETVGGALQGRNGQNVVVNVASGQVVVQDQDDLLVARGPDAAVVRVYNSNGSLNDENGDGWSNGITLLRVLGTLNTLGSTIQRTEPDGGTASYDFNATSNAYQSFEGAGAADVITYIAADGQYEWRDGTTGATQSYEGSGACRLLASRDPSGNALKYAYGTSGFLASVIAPNGNGVFYDYAGNNLSQVRTVAGGTTTTRVRYGYDNARQLVAQSSGRGQSITYSYDAAGQVTSIRDWTNGKTTTYAYDLAGRKLRERVVQGGITYQDNSMAYDARGNLRDVSDGRAHIVMEYDQVGNRTRVATSVNYQGASGETGSITDRYFLYDAMSRQVRVDAVNAAGEVGTQGHEISYDRDGNRVRDKSWGSKVVTSGGEQVLAGYREDGTAIYANVPVTYRATTGLTTEEYRYDDLNRLVSVVRDGTQIDVRRYDGADRVIQSGPGLLLPIKYAEIINQGLTPDQMNGKETRINRYDANGRLMHQTVLESNNAPKLDISWDPAETVSAFGATFHPGGYDAAGNVRGYTVTNYEGGFTNAYTTDLKAFEGYQASTTRGQSTKQQPGVVTQQYDANGYLVRISDATQPANDRTFVNDANGKVLYVSQAGNAQRQFIVNGEVLGQYGVRVNPTDPATGYNNAPNFSNVADFNFGYARISASYPSASPGAYTVRTGDTLQSIAQSAYGDSSLWFRIAEANALGSNRDLRVGQTLNIPNRVATASNNNTTFKPYDPSEIEGDKTPNLATPEPKKKKRNWFAQLVAVVLAAAVAYIAGVAYLAAYGTGVTTAAGTVYSSASLVTAGALGGAAGSVAGQVVGIATGLQDGFNWKDLALSALAGGIGMGLGGFQGAGGVDFGAGPFGNRIVQSALGNAITQGIGVATGLQQRFDWRGVAASGVGAATGQVVSGPLSQLGDFVGRVASGIVAGATAAAMKGGRIVVQQVVVDAFGNALGESVAEIASSTGNSRREFDDATILALTAIDDLRHSKVNQANQDGRVAEEPETGPVPTDPSLLRKIVSFASTPPEPVMTPAAQAGGHYYLIGLVGRALGLADERLAQIMAYSQFPDQVSAADGYTNGFRYKVTGPDYPPAAAGLEMMIAVHALNGRPLEDNLRTYKKIIAQNADDDAAIGVALHGLVDSVFHAHYVPGGGLVSYSAPMGHGLDGSDPDYISPDKAKLAAGAVIEGLETVGGKRLTSDQRRAAMNYVNAAIDRAHALTQIEEIRGGGQVIERGAREELHFRAISAELLGASGSLPVLQPNDIQSPIAARAITRELTIAQAQEFLSSVSGAPASSRVATNFAKAGMRAIEKVVNDYYALVNKGGNPEAFRAASLYDTKVWSLRALVESATPGPRSGIRY